MKALILAGGKGTRLRPLTFSMAKQLIPIANKPVIEYGLDSIIEAGLKDIGIIVAENGGEFEERLGDGSDRGIKITYIYQDRPLGLAHAVKVAEPFLGKDDFIMYLGDNLIKSPIKRLVSLFKAQCPAALILLTSVPNPSDFGVAEMKGNRVIGLTEKPESPKSNLALVGVYLFSKKIHASIAKLRPSGRGEYEITEAIQGLIDDGEEVISETIKGWWKDTGTIQSMLDANRMILEDLLPQVEGTVDEESKIEGRVRIEHGAKIEKSLIRGPVVIGKDCLIRNSFIGPFTSIAERSVLIDAEVENSILFSECLIDSPPSRIDGSLIGRGANISRSLSGPRCLNMVVGEASAISFP